MRIGHSGEQFGAMLCQCRIANGNLVRFGERLREWQVLKHCATTKNQCSHDHSLPIYNDRSSIIEHFLTVIGRAIEKGGVENVELLTVRRRLVGHLLPGSDPDSELRLDCVT